MAGGTGRGVGGFPARLLGLSSDLCGLGALPRNGQGSPSRAGLVAAGRWVPALAGWSGARAAVAGVLLVRRWRCWLVRLESGPCLGVGGFVGGGLRGGCHSLVAVARVFSCWPRGRGCGWWPGVRCRWRRRCGRVVPWLRSWLGRCWRGESGPARVAAADLVATPADTLAISSELARTRGIRLFN